MAPPLIQLSDIALSFGGAALLDGVELAVSAGERVCLVGRNGSGKSTLLKIAAGLIEPDRGTRFVQPGASIRYLPQEPDLSGLCQHAGLRGGRPRPDRRSASGALSAAAARHERRGGPGAPVGRRGAARGAGARAGTRPGYSPARRADQPSRPAGHRVAGERAAQPARRPGADQPRPALPGEPVTQHRVARSRRRRGASRSALPASRPGATSVSPRRRSPSTSSIARSSPRSTGGATASPPGASATCAAWPT